MQTNLLWTGREYHSLENCLVTTTGRGTEVSSTIIGYYGGKIYRVDYHIRTDRHWQTLYAEINSRHNNRQQWIRLEGDGQGNWKGGGGEAARFRGCIDIDISLTPFTNPLPINRLGLPPGGAREIRVIYIDLLEGRIEPVRQKYTRLREEQYRFENVPNDFEAAIHVDKDGFVKDYPALFVRTAALKTNYPLDSQP